LGQEAEQVGVVWAGQYAVAIQGIIPDGVCKAGSGLIAGICADPFPDGVGQGLTGTTLYVEMYFHALRQRLILGFILGGGMASSAGSTGSCGNSSAVGSEGSWGVSVAPWAGSSAIGSRSAALGVRVLRCRASGQVSGRVPGVKYDSWDGSNGIEITKKGTEEDESYHMHR